MLNNKNELETKGFESYETLQNELSNAEDSIRNVIEITVSRGEALEETLESAEALEEKAEGLYKTSKKTKREYQKQKYAAIAMGAGGLTWRPRTLLSLLLK